MTTIPEIQDLAAELQQHRTDWPDIIPIVNYLLPWRHVLPYDELHDMALAWVKDHGNRTPASLKYMPGVPPKTAGGSSTSKKNQTDLCVCGERHEKRPMLLNEPPVDSPERAAAKARAREAIAAAQRKAKHQPEPDLTHPPCEHCSNPGHTQHTCPAREQTPEPQQEAQPA